MKSLIITMNFDRKSPAIVLINVFACAGLFFLLWTQQVLGAQNVEIFAQGKRYQSIAEYRGEEKTKHSESSIPIGKENGFDVPKQEDLVGFQDILGQAVRRVLLPLELTFGLSEIKTFCLKSFWNAQQTVKSSQNSLLLKDKGYKATDPFAHSYDVVHQIGLNAEVQRAVDNFIVGIDPLNPSKQVGVNDLEQELMASSAVYDGPLLLVSNQRKIMVMAFKPLEEEDASLTKMKAR